MRQRANSSLTEIAMTQSGFGSHRNASGPAEDSFEALLRSMVDDKYNREYKLDKKTRAKAVEILLDYFAKN